MKALVLKNTLSERNNLVGWLITRWEAKGKKKSLNSMMALEIILTEAQRRKRKKLKK